jgi:hypothetical protein
LIPIIVFYILFFCFSRVFYLILQQFFKRKVSHDISQPVPQGGDGTQDAENSRIAAIANEFERLCAVHEAQLGDSQADVITK